MAELKLTGDEARAILAQAAPSASAQPAGEEMVRFCPECGSLGDVPAGYQACCPDASHARIVPKRFAEICRDTFRLLVDKVDANPIGNLAAPAPASPADQVEDARDAAWWIPVAYDSQPPNDTDVFVRGKDACGALRHDVAGMFSGYWMSQSTQNNCDFEVSHWLPIPKDTAMSASKEGA